MRYRLLVVGGSAAEVVRHTGGWLFDVRAMGWDVVVSIPDPSGMRGGEVLGAVVLEPGSEPATIIREVNPHVLASNASEHLTVAQGGRARDYPHADGSATVYWGPHPPDAADHLHPAQHQSVWRARHSRNARCSRSIPTPAQPRPRRRFEPSCGRVMKSCTGFWASPPRTTSARSSGESK
ncbi:hypothetical protein [Nocardia sputi]|uniref:hypothetical protein n=1 Tax=Nocardia sputi TaxID=2943705 RepID=UPI0020BE9D93|nr:hypothetical protein [Nocardia sputi]